MLLELIYQSLYFFLPVYIANMIPSFAKHLPFFNQPLHEKKLGSHKTWRGLILGTLAGGITFALQKYAYAQGFPFWSIIDYKGFPFLMGFALGFGALLGDVLKSYYKRKANIAPGTSWIPYDQLDFVLGGIIFCWFFYVPPIEIIVTLLLLSPFLHLAANYIGYLLHINQRKL